MSPPFQSPLAVLRRIHGLKGAPKYPISLNFLPLMIAGGGRVAVLRGSLAGSSGSTETPSLLHHRSLEKPKSSRRQLDTFLMEYFLL